MGEFFASHGFKFISIPSKGVASSRLQGGTIEDAYAQSRDVDVVLQNLSEFGVVEESRVYLSGFSFGGLSHIINGMKASGISGVLSFDGTIKYMPQVLTQSFDYSPKNFKIPFVHFSQKDIPDSLLTEEGTDVAINDNFEFFDAISSDFKYQLKLKALSHTFFASFGLLFNERDVKQDFSYVDIASGYTDMLAMSLSFLNVLEKNNTASMRAGGHVCVDIDTTMFEVVKFTCEEQTDLTVYDLLHASQDTNFSDLNKIYASLLSDGMRVELDESTLNSIGLQLIFSESTYTQGVNIFKFALSNYPASANLYDSLAEGYLYHGDEEEALSAFQLSLELNSDNTNAIDRIKEIQRN